MALKRNIAGTLGSAEDDARAKLLLEWRSKLQPFLGCSDALNKKNWLTTELQKVESDLAAGITDSVGRRYQYVYGIILTECNQYLQMNCIVEATSDDGIPTTAVTFETEAEPNITELPTDLLPDYAEADAPNLSSGLNWPILLGAGGVIAFVVLNKKGRRKKVNGVSSNNIITIAIGAGLLLLLKNKKPEPSAEVVEQTPLVALPPIQDQQQQIYVADEEGSTYTDPEVIYESV